MITRRSSASAADRWDTRKPGAPNRINRSPSDRMDGIRNPTAHDSALTDQNRETAYRRLGGDDLSQPTAVAGDSFRVSALQREDPNCITLHTWISSGEFPSWNEVKGLHPELRSLWHHRNNLSLDNNGIIWPKRSSQSSLLQLLVPKPGREQLFLTYHASLLGGHLGRNWTLARLAHRFYWSGMSDDIKDWLRQCAACVKRKSRKWTEAFPMKNKCADTVANILVEHIILRFGMPLVIHSNQGREFENGLMKSLCTLLGCTKTRTAPYHPESDGMIERFNRTCLMMLSMFMNDRRDNWHKLMNAYRTSVHEPTGYSPFRLMMAKTVYGEDGTASPFACNNFVVSPPCGAHGKQWNTVHARTATTIVFIFPRYNTR